MFYNSIIITIFVKQNQDFMKKLLALLLLSTLSFAQRPQKIITKFYIQEAVQNNVDVTEYYVRENAFIAFFEQDEKLFMTSILEVSSAQSHGGVEPISQKHLEETYDSYEADIYHFNWYYKNTYDNVYGTAEAQFIKVYLEDSVLYVLEIHCENGDTLIYRGENNK